MIYSGFWRRLGAGLVDQVVLHIITGILLSVLGINIIETIDVNLLDSGSVVGFKGTNDGTFLQTIVPVEFILLWFYFAFFQSSKYQATPGMMILSMQIVAYDGKKISFWRASARFLASYLSWMICGIGYLMIAFTPRKQALHDYISKTLVIIKS